MYFKRRGDAKAYLKQMLNKYEVGDRVSAEDETILFGMTLGYEDGAVPANACRTTRAAVASNVQILDTSVA